VNAELLFEMAISGGPALRHTKLNYILSRRTMEGTVKCFQIVALTKVKSGWNQESVEGSLVRIC
jgi:hypothetical protein